MNQETAALLDVIFNPDSHPLEVKLAQEELAKSGVTPNPITPITQPMGFIRNGAYSYEFGLNKRILKADPKLVTMPNGQKVYEEQDQIVIFTAVCNIYHNGKVSSSRIVSRRKNQHCYSDRRYKGKGSGLTRDEFVSTFPQRESGLEVTQALENILPLKQQGTNLAGLVEQFEAMGEALNTLASIIALMSNANHA